jgi:hypothetical protein
MSTIPQWTGREIRALRAARRMSVRAFATHLGVSDRMVSKWEAAGATIRPRTVNQAALDTSLASCGPAIRVRFERLAGGHTAHVDVVQPGGGVAHLVRHPVDGKLMTYVESGPYSAGSGRPVAWLVGYYIDVLPTSCADYQQFVAATGHRAPTQWKDGGFTDSLADTPVQVPWIDAQAYAGWASKALPTPDQWDRAADGDEGLVAGHLPEWCATERGPRRHESPTGATGNGLPGFRCAVRGEELLRLLAI